tara:strand:+ start:3257 stop:3727 length:471 start_codon:yes stop_codon:yes gene_type:complete
MARRQNHKLSAKAAEKEIFTLPNQITKPILGLENDAQDFINTLLLSYRFGNHIFDTQTPHHEDWIMLFVILTNEAEGRATVTKNIVEITGRAYGTVRASLQRFEELGYIEPNQRIGRSELYVLTQKMKKAVNAFAKTFWPNVARARNSQTRVKDPA